MKKGLLLLILVFGGINMNAQTNVGHVDSRLLFDTLQLAKEAEINLLAFQEEGYKELQEMQKSLESAAIKYQQNEKNYSQVIKQMEQEKLQKKQQALQTREQELQRELQIRQQDANRPIEELILNAVTKVAEANKMDYIIEKSQAIYVGGGADLTKEVIKELLKLEKELLEK